MKLFIVTVELSGQAVRTSYRLWANGPEVAAFLAAQLAKRAGVLVDVISSSELGE